MILAMILPRVESGSDYLDDLGQLDHIFDGSSGPHPGPNQNYVDVTWIFNRSPVGVGIW